jgi:hypothetical protein
MSNESLRSSLNSLMADGAIKSNEMSSNKQSNEELAKRIRAEHATVISAVKVVPRAIAAGELLLQAKNRMGHGQWLFWLEIHCALPPRTAQRYMNLASRKDELAQRARPKYATLADLPLSEADRLLKTPRPSRTNDPTDKIQKLGNSLIRELEEFKRVQPESARALTADIVRLFERASLLEKGTA